MQEQIEVCATCKYDIPGYSSVIGTIPHCCERHWHCKPGKDAIDYVPREEDEHERGKEEAETSWRE